MSFKMHGILAYGRGINVSYHMFPLIEGHTNQLFWSSSRKEIVFFTQPAQFTKLTKGVCLPCLYMATLHAISILVSNCGCGSDLKGKKASFMHNPTNHLQLNSTNYAQAFQPLLLEFSYFFCVKK